MEAKILQLIKLIGEEVVIFEAFLQLLNRQQEALVANDMTLLQGVTDEQELLALKTTAIEKQRNELVAALSVQLNRDSSDINLTELTKLVSEPESNQIRTLQTTLTDLHEQIAKIKSRNDFLIRKSMEYINNTLTYLSASGEKEATYTSEIRKSPVRRKHTLMDRRI